MAAVVVTILRHRARKAVESFHARINPDGDDDAPVAPTPSQIRVDSVHPHENLLAERLPRHWQVGLCDCFADWSTFFLVVCSPCLASGEIYRKGLDDSFASGCMWWLIINGFPFALLFLKNIWIPCAQCTYPCLYTRPLRLRRSIDGDLVTDFLLYLFCCPCQMCRELREAKDIRSERNSLRMPDPDIKKIQEQQQAQELEATI